METRAGSKFLFIARLAENRFTLFRTRASDSCLFTCEMDAASGGVKRAGT